MRKLFIYMTMSIDGFLCGPNGELDWMLRTPDQELNDDIVAIISSADTGIIGYPTAIGMIPYWVNVEKDASASPFDRDLAKVINKQHGVVLSNTEVKLDFPNSELVVVKSDNEFIDAVNKFKNQPGRNIGVPGGVRTAQKIASLGLADEYLLLVHPVAIGSGKGLFTHKVNLQLVSSKSYGSGVVRLRYRSV
jgi:dihydrofolate reductase